MKKGNIIIADDQEPIRYLIEEIVAKQFSQFNTESYPSGQSLEERLNKQRGEARLIILDNQMNPGKTGLDLIKDYSSSKNWREVPFILCCSENYTMSCSELAKRAMEYGAFNYIMKPVSIITLIENIKEALKLS